MALTHCPMCQTSISTDEIANSCSTCGVDLSRWMPRPEARPTFIQAPNAGGQAVAAQESESHRLAFGVLGAVVGACIGSGLLYGFYAMVGFRHPLMGIGIGLVTGLAARWLNKGGDDRLGFVAGALSLAAVVLTLFLMYGTFPMLSVVTAAASVSFAYCIASYWHQSSNPK
jgi:hypothetical protein